MLAERRTHDGRHVMDSNLATWKVLIALALITLLAAACGSGSSTSGHASPSPSATATGTLPADSAICQDVRALHTSMQKLLSFQPGKDTIASLKANVSDVNDKLTALRISAHDTLSAQWGPLQATMRNLQSAVTSSVGTGQAAGIVRAMGDVRTKAQNLFTAAEAYCPSSAS
jgi:hypothetical protein